ncbi:non-canonical purine NTP pyrophosphatase [Amphibacillus cookii]|uniref:non-canonical purine NTP pyrophosphatase n=1 Tax=Amphibacillus cookii TaxID=767787 RepID=UPI00195C7346|nr:non-canonical purine NTP pyrophosphatase [Amphibacillus cookii]MBM7542947.1 XTP/dITP diphosphohydrolase [Amphibacillus cookii]
MKLIIATWNKQKQEELTKGLTKLAIPIKGLSPSIPDVEETGQTFLANAQLKVNTIYKHFPRSIIMGEDSGLTVTCLNGFPGVKTARFLSGTDADRASFLLNKVNDQPLNARQCAFHSVIYLRFPDHTDAIASGQMNGWINSPEQQQIQDYQSVFQLANGQYLDQINNEAYAAFSHRQQALRQAYLLIKEWLESRGDHFE